MKVSRSRNEITLLMTPDEAVSLALSLHSAVFKMARCKVPVRPGDTISATVEAPEAEGRVGPRTKVTRVLVSVQEVISP